MKDYGQIISLIGTLKTICNAMQKQKFQQDVINDIKAASEQINVQLYYHPSLKFQKKYNLTLDKDYMFYREELETLIGIWENSILNRRNNQLDEQFWEIYDFFKYVDKDVICKKVLGHFANLSEARKIDFLALPYYYPEIKGKLDMLKNNYSLVELSTEIMLENIELFRDLYNNLYEEKSRKLLVAVVKYWFDFDLTQIQEAQKTNYPDYYAIDILLGRRVDTIINYGVSNVNIFKEKYSIVDKAKKSILPMLELKETVLSEEKKALFIPVFDLQNDLFEITKILFEVNKNVQIYLRCEDVTIWPQAYFIVVV